VNEDKKKAKLKLQTTRKRYLKRHILISLREDQMSVLSGFVNITIKYEDLKVTLFNAVALFVLLKTK